MLQIAQLELVNKAKDLDLTAPTASILSNRPTSYRDLVIGQLQRIHTTIVRLPRLVTYKPVFCDVIRMGTWGKVDYF